MWATEGVAAAIQNCRSRKSVLVILVEPPQRVLERHNGTSERSEELLSRIATSSIHRITFSNDAVKEMIREAAAVCLKFPSDESNADFKAFSVYFKLYGGLPNLYFISPLTGQTLLHRTGFVSPRVFTESLAAATKNVSGTVLKVPEFRNSSIANTTTDESISLVSEAVQAPEGNEQTSTMPHAAKNTSKRTSAHEADEATEAPELTSRGTRDQKAPPTSPSPTVTKSMKLTKTNQKDAYGGESRLLARLPGGTQARKSFPGTTRFSVVRSWLSEEVQSPASSMVIATAFPRRVFDLSEDPKMLLELNLVPSETLIVALTNENVGPSPRGQTGHGPASGIRSYASGALDIVSGFFRSFVADNTTPAPARPETTHSRNSNATPYRHAPEQTPIAMQIDRDRAHVNRRELDDENLLSNGNSTQYGWNPDDENEP